MNVLMPAEPPIELSAEVSLGNPRYGEMDDVLFDLCRVDDYQGLYREFVKRFGKPEADLCEDCEDCDHGMRGGKLCESCKGSGRVLIKDLLIATQQRVKELKADLASVNRQYTELAERDNSVMDVALRERTEACAKACIDMPQQDGTTYTYWPCVNAIRASF